MIKILSFHKKWGPLLQVLLSWLIFAKGSECGQPTFAFAKCGLIRGGAIFTRILSDMKLFCPNLLNKIQVMVWCHTFLKLKNPMNKILTTEVQLWEVLSTNLKVICDSSVDKSRPQLTKLMSTCYFSVF